MSLESRCYRSEHWVVVQGTAAITAHGKTVLLGENQSTLVAAGTEHRLANPGEIPVFLIVVQAGAYGGEEEIDALS